MKHQVTVRATLAGLVIGTMVLCTNFQFGLQTGWASMMSLPSALLGFAVFKTLPLSRQFTPVENVFVQSIAVAVGTGPLAYGLIGIIPAMEKFMTPEESGLGQYIKFSLRELMIWSTGLAFFGVFIAIPIRYQVLVKEKLPFPLGTATAILILILHGTEVATEDESLEQPYQELANDDAAAEVLDDLLHDPSVPQDTPLDESFASNIRNLTTSFIASSIYTVVSYFIPILRNLPIFGSMAAKYLWTFQPSPAYVGQGIIMGLPTVSYMLFGAILGWGVLSPVSRYFGWAPGKIDDWQNGSQGWIMWVSLSIMISDSLVSFIVMSLKSIATLITNHSSTELESQLDISNSHQDPCWKESDKGFFHKVTWIGLAVSGILCCICIKIIFGPLVPLYAIFTSIILALLLSILAIRALGETDLNPVSGIGKLSQLIFALIVPANSPSKIVINLVAGAIAEAGAQQAGDLMQDLKTGYLLGASPKAQFVAQLIGATYSIFVSSIMYKVYNHVYTIPNAVFRVPTAVIWIDCARLVSGKGLPPHLAIFALVFGIIFATISLVKNLIPKNHQYYKYLVYLPSGVAVGVGIYNTPSFTLARFLGGLVAYICQDRDKVSMIITSSGLVLGEGLFSVVTMVFASLGLKQWT